MGQQSKSLMAQHVVTQVWLPECANRSARPTYERNRPTHNYCVRYIRALLYHAPTNTELRDSERFKAIAMELPLERNTASKMVGTTPFQFQLRICHSMSIHK